MGRTLMLGLALLVETFAAGSCAPPAPAVAPAPVKPPADAVPPGSQPMTQPPTQPGSATDPLTWPIEKVCEPVQTTTSPRQVRDLGDGTVVYQRHDGTRFRGTRNTCRCLAPGTRIATPSGDRAVEHLRVGEPVWTIDRDGVRRAVTIWKVQRVGLPGAHRFVRLTLADGRVLRASPGHPLADGRGVEHIAPGELVDGAVVVAVDRITAGGGASHDLLPGGDTGIYFADGIPTRTTMTP